MYSGDNAKFSAVRRSIIFLKILLRRRQTGKRGTIYGVPLFVILALIIFFNIPVALCGLSDDLNRKGIERMKEGEYREAIVYFESAYSANPEDENIRKNLSIAYHQLAVRYASEKDWSYAIMNEEQSLKHDPDNKAIKEQLGIFYNNYGLAYIEKERYSLAKDRLKRALTYTPDSVPVKTNLYNVILKEAESSYRDKNEYKAIRLAKEAISLLPDRAPAYIFAGNIYYQQDNFIDALKRWHKALELDPDNTDLHARIEKLKRERGIEEEFKTRKREHFKIRFERKTDSEYIWAISDVLEDARRKLYREFNLRSDKVIPVIVYRKEQFKEATDAADWTLGLYDGKIRLREQDISRGDDILRKILYHEYAHAVLYLTYGSNIPIWLHEGFAQFNEPKTPLSDSEKNYLRSYLKKERDFSLNDLDNLFTQRDNPASMRAAYLESRLFFSYLIEEYRRYNIKRLFEELKEGNIWQIALRDAYHRSLERLEEEFGSYLEENL